MNALTFDFDDASDEATRRAVGRDSRETKTTNPIIPVISDADYKCERLCYHAWLQPPARAYRTEEDMSTMLSSHSVMDISHTRLPLFVPPNRTISFTPSRKATAPESKPNLISGLCAFLLNEVRHMYSEQQVADMCASVQLTDNGPHHHINSSSSASATSTAADVVGVDELLKCLSRVTAFTSRHPLKRVLMTMSEPSEPWKVYARFVAGTLFVERGDFYVSVTGTTGSKFEERVKAKRDNRLRHRIYSVVSAQLSDLRVVLTGEADAVDARGNVVEIKTRPARRKRADDHHCFQNWLQCALSGVGTVITGTFSAGKKRVSFHPTHVEVLSLDQYAERNHLTCTPSARALAFRVYHRFISWVRGVCEAAPGQVFEIRYNPSARSVTASPDDTFPFPIDEEVVRAALHAVLRHFKAPASALKDTTATDHEK